ncbi:hypothetical protein TOPH_05964 [Tolypocladium ophioglossoides CBS 100239]|uniref:Fungal lipase-type domain-containing protein n=1 Tax=Tolypocladium ophioglossoides (strain CBS 100239) TaxID=1163406 RepID=A0A0L0N5K2_TOLOC|nr:hypothetical protein TOPH_05964 [Tolypocladium ophioglossoides CBS 100239]
MGFFTRNSSDNKAKRQQRPSLADPPNVFYTPSSPPLPARSATTAPAVNALYSNPYAGFSQPQLAAPSGWGPPAPGATPGAQFQPPVVVNHYYIGACQPQYQQPQQGIQGGSSSLGRWTGPMVGLDRSDGLYTPLHGSTDAVYDDICTRFDDVISLIDRERYAGDESDLFMCQSAPQPSRSQHNLLASPPPNQPSSTDRSWKKQSSEKRLPSHTDTRKLQKSDVAAAVVSGNYFSKVDFYANSRLPLNLPPLALYMPTWPLLCLAAQHSHRVYSSPTGPERNAHVPSDWLSGSKAMTIKSVLADHANTIVFAIRGTASFMDWAVNLRSEPAPPIRFLDDEGNACHAGFLSVARSMVRPVARRLRQMLREDPGRAAYSLLITGHSAGGAVAALLYMHMLAVSPAAESELNALTGCFKRVHCVTFGTPPVSLLPLTKPDRPELRKSLFLSFVNEGDPLVRADKAYVKSLLELLASPPPATASPPLPSPRPREGRKKPDKSSSRAAPVSWPVPAATLHNAGRIVVLRSGSPHAPPADRKTVEQRLDEGVVAVTCREDHLHDVTWGDPVCHLMCLYAARVEVLAVGAVTAKRR